MAKMIFGNNTAQVQEKLDAILHEKNAFTDILAKIEDKTKVKRVYLVMGLGVFLMLYLAVGYGAQFLCNFLGFLYPAYASVKAIESKEKDDDTKWLTYWVVYSVFSLLEFFADIFLFWIPFYPLLKCIFLIYCMIPVSWNGSVTLYKGFIRPFVLKHQKKIDESLDKAAGMAEKIIDEVRGISKRAIEEGQDMATDASGELIKRQIMVDKDE